MPVREQQSGLLQTEMEYTEKRITKFFDGLLKEGITPSCLSHAAFWMNMRYSLNTLDEDSFEFYLEQVEEMLSKVKYGSHNEIPKNCIH